MEGPLGRATIQIADSIQSTVPRGSLARARACIHPDRSNAFVNDFFHGLSGPSSSNFVVLLLRLFRILLLPLCVNFFTGSTLPATNSSIPNSKTTATIEFDLIFLIPKEKKKPPIHLCKCLSQSNGQSIPCASPNRP